MEILTFQEQDQIFNEIYTEELDELIIDGEESLRGTEATTEQYSLENYFLVCTWHICSLKKITNDQVDKIKQLLPFWYTLYFKQI